MDADQMLQNLCAKIADRLATRDLRVVFAESCTAGLVSARLARVPGISNYLCGSAVTYREATKSEWLGVPHSLLEEHTAVSAPVTVQMARGVLARTPEADISVAVTGHLGPEAPPEQDGVIFVATAVRVAGRNDPRVEVRRCRLRSARRVARQREAALEVLQTLWQRLQEATRA